MLKETVTYIDYNGTERTEDFYFNLTKAEVMEMEMSVSGGFTEMIKRVAAAQDAPTIIKTFKELILTAYGEKSADGRRFEKVRNGVRLADEFAQTEAYSALFMKYATDADAASKFVNGILPPDISAQANAAKN